jgi:LysR family cys regulon transcriptional activator
LELQQLRYVVAVYENACNVSLASRQLRISQPGISRQIRSLETEIGFPIFDRSNPSRPRPTPAGTELIARATVLLREAGMLGQECDDVRTPDLGSLSIAASDPEVRHILPAVIGAFRVGFPAVALHLHHGTPEQVSDLLLRQRADVAIVTDARALDAGLFWLPCYRWQYRLLVPEGHALLRAGQPLMTDLIQYPLITAPAGPAGRASLEASFEASGLAGRVVMTAIGSDVIETYVQHGIGIGIVTMVAERLIPGLVTIDVSHLFDTQTTWVGLRRGTSLRSFVYAFLEILAPHLSRSFVDECAQAPDQAGLDHALGDLHVHLLG